jgi:hypothetical protein
MPSQRYDILAVNGDRLRVERAGADEEVCRAAGGNEAQTDGLSRPDAYQLGIRKGATVAQ